MSAEFDPTGPQARKIIDGFLKETDFMPQMPLAGIARFFIDAIPMIEAGQVSWEDLVSMPLQGEVGTDALETTVNSHRRDNVANVPQLREKLDFALELVQSGANHAIALLAGHDDSVGTFGIGPLDQAETQAATEFLRDPRNRKVVLDMARAVSRGLREDAVVEKLEEYRPNMAKISRDYAKYTPAHPQYAELMGAKEDAKKVERDGLIVVAEPRVIAALQPYSANNSGVLAFGRVLLSGPTPQLLRKHRMI